MRIKDGKITRPDHLSNVSDIGNKGIPDTNTQWKRFNRLRQLLLFVGRCMLRYLKVLPGQKGELFPRAEDRSMTIYIRDRLVSLLPMFPLPHGFFFDFFFCLSEVTDLNTSV